MEVIKDIRTRKGANLNLKGGAEKILDKTVSPTNFAIRPDDFFGIAPKLILKEGATLKLGSPIFFSKKNPHCACYFEAFALAAKKYGGKNHYLKRVLKSIESTFAKINDDPYTYWCEVFNISEIDLVNQNRTKVLVDKRYFTTSVRTGSEWLALESRGLHIFNGKKYQYSNNTNCLLYTSPSPRDQRGARVAAWG